MYGYVSELNKHPITLRIGLFSVPHNFMRTHESFSTSDLPQATFLYASGVPLIGIEPVDDRRRSFCFERIDGLDELLMVFASGREVSIVPSRLLAAHKHLKSLLLSR